MILNLIIERQGLPTSRIRWSTASVAAVHNASSNHGPNSADPTIAQLVEQVNDVIPLEAEEWGFEDYAVEVNGFECLHFCRVSQVLKDEDHVTIRPWQSQEVRFRALAGRQQISADGRHLIDGVSFGKPFLRRVARPAVRIAAKKKARAELLEDQGEDEEEDSPAGLLLPAQTKHPVLAPWKPSRELYPGLTNRNDQTGPAFLSRSTSQGEQPRKRRLEPAFQDEREGKRVRSALHPSTTGPGSRRGSVGSKNVRFQGVPVGPDGEIPSMTPAALGPEDEDEDDEDDDFDPENEDDSGSDLDSETSGSESNKENLNPDTYEYTPTRHHPTEPGNAVQISEQAHDLPFGILTSAPEASRSSNYASSPTNSSSVTSSDSDIDSSDDSSENDSGNEQEAAPQSSEYTSSDDDSSTNSEASDSGDEQVPNAAASYVHASETDYLSAPMHAATPPGQGKEATKRRNVRRRQSMQLQKLKESGVLDPNATLQDLRQWQADHGGNSQAAQQAAFEYARQSLLDSLADGGVDVTSQQPNGELGSTAPQAANENPAAMGQGVDIPKHAPRGRSSSPKYYSSREQQTESSDAKSKLEVSESATKERPMEQKRRRIDVGASQRLLLNGIGLRVPKTKVEEERLREVSRQKAQQEAEKHQKRVQAEIVEQEEDWDEDWQEHIDLKSVECADPSIQYSTPPFPFEQRWDPQQHWNNWRPKGKRKGKGAKRKRAEEEIEEHYDASMYDDQPAGIAQEGGDVPINSEVAVPVVEAPAPLDVSENVDLLQEQALVGAKIAFKQLELSEATDWQPQVSEYKSAIVNANEDSTLTLLLDEKYRVQKEIDPETGEIVASRFILADADDGQDDGILEIPYADLIEPKLLIAAVTPAASQSAENQASTLASPNSKGVNVIDAIAKAVDAVVSAPEETSDDADHVMDEGEVTAVEASFNESTQTAVDYRENKEIEVQASKESNLGIDPAVRDEASMLIREAGFRAIIDPEVAKPLLEQTKAREIEILDGHDEVTQSKESAEGVVPQQSQGLSSSISLNLDGNNDSFDVFKPADNMSSEEIRSSLAPDADESITTRLERCERKAAAMLDIVDNLTDSSSTSADEPALKAAEFIKDTSGAATPESVVRRSGTAIDIVRQIMHGNGTNKVIPPEESPNAVPAEAEDVGELPEVLVDNQRDGSQDSLLVRDALLDSDPIPSKSTKKSYGKKRNARRTVSLTQPEIARNRETRGTSRRATAVANTITLSSDDDDNNDDDDDASSGVLPPSTAPAQVGFRPINLPSASQPAPSPSQAAAGTGKSSMVDLTEIASDPLDTPSADERVISPKQPPRSSFGTARRGSIFKRPKMNRLSEEARSRSQI